MLEQSKELDPKREIQVLLIDCQAYGGVITLAPSKAWRISVCRNNKNLP